MRGTNTAWRAQIGSPVSYASDRRGGSGVVVRRKDDTVVVRDDKTGQEIILTIDEIRCDRPSRVARGK